MDRTGWLLEKGVHRNGLKEGFWTVYDETGETATTEAYETEPSSAVSLLMNSDGKHPPNHAWLGGGKIGVYPYRKTAMHSISTRAPKTSPVVPMAVRAGRFS